ncbi:MAG: hypothetical protein ACM3S1_00735 [Hyphomicrobiales bacterium]
MKNAKFGLFALPAAALVFAAGIIIGGLASDGGDGSPPSGPDTPTQPPVSTQPPPASAGTAAAPHGHGEAPPLVDAHLSTNGPGVAYSFDGSPAAPQPAYWLDSWDVQVHSRDQATFQELEPVEAQHGPGCEPPGVHHEVTRYEDAVFHCRDHVMTAISTGGYGMIYLTPPDMVDFSNGEAVISFDVSTLDLSERDWWDVWITPYEDNLALPLEDWLPDGQGEPARGIHIGLGTEDQLCAEIIRDHQAQETGHCDAYLSYSSFLTPDAQRRDTFEIHISSTHIKVGMPKYNQWWEDTNIPDLGWTQGVVQFGHHSYNPKKCDGDCQPNTWHWDNISISNAVPFTIIRADSREAHDGETVTFRQPAPANAYLRFAGIGAVSVSFDGGATWQKAQRANEEVHHEDHFASYRTPIPEGTTSVVFKFADDDWYSGPFLARDISIWAR